MMNTVLMAEPASNRRPESVDFERKRAMPNRFARLVRRSATLVSRAGQTVSTILALTIILLGSLASVSSAETPSTPAAPDTQTAAGASRTHAIAMHGQPAYPAGFSHFGYARPDAPKGGAISLGVQGTFNSLNPLIVFGAAASGVRGLVYESLLARSADEPFTLYAHLAQAITVPDDRSAISFHMDPRARFSDGQPLTADDVVFSFELLRARGRPNHRSYYSKVVRVERPDKRTVTFVLAEPGTPAASIDRELPLILGLMPILPRHASEAETFEQTSMTPPVGSGPYTISEVRPGARIVYARNPQYWARDLPQKRGLHNFDRITYDYFRDANALFEAFKAGLIDVRYEGDPGQWAQEYDFPAVAAGDVAKKEIALGVPAGMNALVFNTRRKPFNDPRVRQALIAMFDFAWVNQNLYFGAYARSDSYFARSELAAAGRPADERERELLAPFLDAVKPSVMDGTYRLPDTDGSGRDRRQQRVAFGLLRAAGYKMSGGTLVGPDGTPLTFSLNAVTATQERLFLAFARSLKPLGITVNVRQVDTARAQRNMTEFNFDMAQFRWGASLSPGNEQSFRWSAAQADNAGSFNFAGVKSPAVDAMIHALLAARDRDDFVSAVRALDRVLISGDYVVPLFHLPNQWLAHWKRIRMPEQHGLTGAQLATWWHAQAE